MTDTHTDIRRAPRGYYCIPVSHLNDIEALCSGLMSVDGTVEGINLDADEVSR